MSTFAFRAIDLAGSPLAGRDRGRARRAQVTEQLRQRGLIVLDVDEKREPVKVDGFLERFRKVNDARARGLLAGSSRR